MVGRADPLVEQSSLSKFKRVIIPSGKLSVGTKKRNEILVLMSQPDDIRLRVVNEHYAIYCHKVDGLLECLRVVLNVHM